MSTFELRLIGAGGEPADLWRTLASHGFSSLPPSRLDEEARVLETTLSIDGAARSLRIRAGRTGRARVRVLGAHVTPAQRAPLRAAVHHMLGLDEDLSAFYALVAADPDLAWAARGAGRMLRSPTVFEDVVKTICTTNCTWSATERMVTALVDNLGAAGEEARAFPTPAAMAAADDDFYREVVRAGYRGPYLRAIAAQVADGSLDLEQLVHDRTLADADVETRLLALPGVGPYAAAHMMMLVGRYSRLILDSWTRPKYARLTGRKAVADRTIERRFRRYREYAGLAFWLFITRDWVPEEG
jgi:3-methyladenine DNA glycosylase/8-oxoguanine DNA glycosylase